MSEEPTPEPPEPQSSEDAVESGALDDSGDGHERPPTTDDPAEGRG